MYVSLGFFVASFTRVAQGGKALGNTARDGAAVATALNELPGSTVIELIDTNMRDIVTKQLILTAVTDLEVAVTQDPDNTVWNILFVACCIDTMPPSDSNCRMP